MSGKHSKNFRVSRLSGTIKLKVGLQEFGTQFPLNDLLVFWDKPMHLGTNLFISTINDTLVNTMNIWSRLKWRVFFQESSKILDTPLKWSPSTTHPRIHQKHSSVNCAIKFENDPLLCSVWRAILPWKSACYKLSKLCPTIFVFG